MLALCDSTFIYAFQCLVAYGIIELNSTKWKKKESEKSYFYYY